MSESLPSSSVFFVSGPLHSGKTTRLLQWTEGRTDVGGIFQPVMEGQRYFVDIATGEQMLLEAPLEEKEAYTIGKFLFSIEAFSWASDSLVTALEDPEIRYIIVDEIGPLEMRGQGLHPVLEDLLESPMPGVAIILVIRDYLLDEVLERYKITGQASPFLYPAKGDGLH